MTVTKSYTKSIYNIQNLNVGGSNGCVTAIRLTESGTNGPSKGRTSSRNQASSSAIETRIVTCPTLFLWRERSSSPLGGAKWQAGGRD